MTRYLAVVTSRDPRRARRRVPLDRLRRLVQREHDVGRGFIALAAVIFGNWRPFGAYAAAILFGASTALSFRLATYSDAARGHSSRRLPYVLTLIAVAGVIGRSDPSRRRWPARTRSSNHRASLAVAARPRRRRSRSRSPSCLSRQTAGVHLIDAAWAIPVAGARGLAALLFSRGRRRARSAATLERAGGRGRIRLGRWLGVAGLCVAPLRRRSRSASTSFCCASRARAAVALQCPADVRDRQQPA